MTELAYLGSMPAAYERSFSATVTALPPGSVVLDRTLFYPAGGGQPCDRGSLRLADGTLLPIVDVVKSGDSVVHRIGRSGGGRSSRLLVGAEVRGEIDWERRFRHMRLHTAQHLVSAVIFNRTRLKTRKATLGGSAASIDLEATWRVEGDWAATEAAVRDYLTQSREVRVLQIPRAEWEAAPAARAGIVPLPPNVDPVRVIEIDGVDRCPCGGTHVRATGEIGRLVLRPPVGARVEFTLDADGPPTPPA